MASTQVFLDSNALLYALDETSDKYSEVVGTIQKLLNNDSTLCTSHHVIEEVLRVAGKVSKTSAIKIVREIGKIPDLVLVEPDAVLAFDQRYAALSDKLKMGINDALLLQLMIDAGIDTLLSYDKQFAKKAAVVGVRVIS